MREEEFKFDKPSEALFANAAIGIIVVNAAKKIELLNSYAAQLFGYQISELIGGPLLTLIPDHIKDKHEKLQDTYMNKPVNRSMGIGLDLSGRKKDGSLFPLEISLCHYKENDAIYYVAFINDATFKKNAENNLLKKQQEIEALNEDLEKEVKIRTNELTITMKALQESKIELEDALEKEKELSELKSRFVAMASHEFRTPLTAINAAADLIEKLKTENEQERRERYLNKIRSSIRNLTMILEEFLSVGKLEEGKVAAQNGYFNLPNMVEETISDLMPFCIENQKINYTHKGDEVILTDASLLKKIIINLVSNGIKFSPDGSHIYLETIAGHNNLELTVTDHGIGISDIDQRHLFDRFYRAKNAENIKGTGLGLHIVNQYVKLMNGTISILSELNVGTQVKIKFKQV